MKILKIIGVSLIVLIVALSLYGYSNIRDRHRGYNIDLKI